MRPHPPNPPRSAEAPFPTARARTLAVGTSPGGSRGRAKAVLPWASKSGVSSSSKKTQSSSHLRSSTTRAASRVSRRDMKAMEIDAGRARARPSGDVEKSAPRSVGVGRDDPAKADGLTVARVGRPRKDPTADASASPTSEDGTAADEKRGSSSVTPAQSTATPTVPGAFRIPSCDANSSAPNALRNPASTSSDTRPIRRVRPSAPTTPSTTAAPRMTTGISSGPFAATKAPRGTATTDADPAITPGRIPPATPAKPTTTELQIPTKGSTPTMALHAMALESSEKATLRPARTSPTTAPGGSSPSGSSVATEGPEGTTTGSTGGGGGEGGDSNSSREAHNQGSGWRVWRRATQRHAFFLALATGLPLLPMPPNAPMVVGAIITSNSNSISAILR
mmetsp:Transcript_19607/g.38971  ORF Transcript_19607/g.38971 Transcript_19607/m.38971 type:complete len:394 (-) Transcript_19607:37-1218(-)